MLEIIERPLTSDEYFQLQTRLQTARDESGRALLKSGTASAVVCHVLMLLVTPERVIRRRSRTASSCPNTSRSCRRRSIGSNPRCARSDRTSWCDSAHVTAVE
jgi:hypothetical protein